MLLFVPRECPKPKRLVMTIEQVKHAFEVLELRDRLIMKLGVIAGMRQSEIFGLRRGRIRDGAAEIVERVCRRDIDTPKTEKAVRTAALSSGLEEDLKLWLMSSVDSGPDGWLFPSEKLTTPIGADNVMNRSIRPKLKEVGLGWVDYRIMRRTHSSLLNEKGIDPKLIADQQGHTVDVNLNVYTQTSLEKRIAALETLESAFVN
jgi:integrase